MKKINLAITGCLGRMGQQLIESAIAHYQNQLRRKGMSVIRDQSVTISDEAPRYTKSPTAIG